MSMSPLVFTQVLSSLKSGSIKRNEYKYYDNIVSVLADHLADLKNISYLL